ncbi:hypothetical protein GOP47_0006773 [Adiantum capillus-veneris]|uniref:Uncharacterized protein n=1 Tax=Adiantum capillus-veneris TaxID=13818 RepID=A0A9D4ZMD0_ADICA|nr:hypothetical protein GOP47_0006773 [Adiantum capillus-veneris]
MTLPATISASHSRFDSLFPQPGASERLAMVDVDRRLNVGHQAHVAGLKRLSARASNGALKPAASPRKGCFSFAPLAQAAMDRLRKGKVEIARGLTDEEFCRIEAPFAFTFPPDLKAVLQEGLPVGAGFPDWRSGGVKQLRLLLNLPIAGIAYEVARGRFWLKQWGSKPLDTEEAVAIARSALKKAPILIPVYRHCYIPASPNLAGNPIFFVRQQEVFCCGFDLADFFEKQDFILPDCELPQNFAHLDASSSRVSSSKSLEIKSFRERSRPCEATGRELPSASRRREVEEADLDDHNDWTFDFRSGNLEGWGRNLDAMAKRGHDATSRGSFEVNNTSGKACRRHGNSVDLSSEHHANDRVAATNGTAIARRIDFWSDLAKKQLMSNVGIVSSKRNGFIAPHGPEKSLIKSLDFGLAATDDLYLSYNADSNAVQRQAPIPYWLERYFDKMATVLRNGGWKEPEISEMFDVNSCPLASNSDLPMNSQSMMQGLMLYVDLLSDVLRRVGWSTTDVAEAFDVDFTFCEQKRRTSTVPPHVATKIGKLAQYAARV